MFENVDGRTDGRTTDAGVTGILIAHLGAFGSGELKNRRKVIIFIKVKVGLKLSNIHHCTVSYNTSCNGNYKLTLQLNLDKYMMYFMV